MALVKYAAPVDEVAGSIGGVTFQRSSAGTIARIRHKPRVTRNEDTTVATAVLSTYAYTWFNTLTQPERDSWDVAAAATTWVNTLGQNYSPTGYVAYIRSNVNAQLAGFVPVTTAPAVLTEVDPGLTFAYVAPTAIRVTAWGTLGSPPDGRILFWTSLGQRPTINTWNGPWVFAGNSLLSALPGPPWTFFNLANPHPDQRIFLKMTVYINQNAAPNPPWERGRCTQPFFDSVFAAAFP